MPDVTYGINVPLTKLEVAASLGAVRAVADSSPGGTPRTLFTAAEKFDRALKEFNEPPKLHGHNRTLKDVRDWITERRAGEVRDAPKNQNTPAAGMTMGALETLDALSAYLNGDDDA